MAAMLVASVTFVSCDTAGDDAVAGDPTVWSVTVPIANANTGWGGDATKPTIKIVLVKTAVLSAIDIGIDAAATGASIFDAANDSYVYPDLDIDNGRFSQTDAVAWTVPVGGKYDADDSSLTKADFTLDGIAVKVSGTNYIVNVDMAIIQAQFLKLLHKTTAAETAVTAAVDLTGYEPAVVGFIATADTAYPNLWGTALLKMTKDTVGFPTATATTFNPLAALPTDTTLATHIIGNMTGWSATLLTYTSGVATYSMPAVATADIEFGITDGTSGWDNKWTGKKLTIGATTGVNLVKQASNATVASSNGKKLKFTVTKLGTTALDGYVSVKVEEIP